MATQEAYTEHNSGSGVRCHHTLKCIWSPCLGKRLPCREDVGSAAARILLCCFSDKDARRYSRSRTENQLFAMITIFMQQPGNLQTACYRYAVHRDMSLL